MIISTTLDRPNCHDIPVNVQVEEHRCGLECSEFGLCTQAYMDDAMTGIAYQQGDRVYLTSKEQRQIEQEAQEKLLDGMNYLERYWFNRNELMEKLGYL